MNRNYFKHLILLTCFCSALFSCKENQKDSHDEASDTIESLEEYRDDAIEDSEMYTKLVIPMNGTGNSKVTGDITFTSDGETVRLLADIKNLKPGAHAIRLHAIPDCSSSDGKSAGGHWEGMSAIHGKWGDQKHHSGDIGNLQADASGNASLTFETDQWCIGCESKMKNIVNRSIIIHASADDFESQPSGAAGARVACGVIKMKMPVDDEVE